MLRLQLEWRFRREWLTSRGYDKLYGARPMGRLVQEKIKRSLAEELLFGKLVNGGEVKVRIKDNAPAFEITPAAPKPVKSKPAKKKAGGEAKASEWRPDGESGQAREAPCRGHGKVESCSASLRGGFA